MKQMGSPLGVDRLAFRDALRASEALRGGTLHPSTLAARQRCARPHDHAIGDSDD